MSQHVATGWPNVCNILPPAMLRSVTFKGCDRLASACKYWANNVGICCVEILLSFGRDFKFYIWLEQFHLKLVENNSLRLMSSLINRNCRSYKQFKSFWLNSQHGNCFNCTSRNLAEREVLQQSCQHHFHFHHSKLVTDTHARANPKWNVRVRLHTWSAIYKNWRWESKISFRVSNTCI